MKSGDATGSASPGNAGGFCRSKDTLEIIRKVLREISPRAVKAFILYYFFDMTLADIAMELGITPEAAKSRLGRARSRVRSHLKQEEEA